MNRIFSTAKKLLHIILMVMAYFCVCDFTGTYVLEEHGASTLLDSLLIISVFAFWFVVFISGASFVSDRQYSWQNCQA